MLSPDGEHADLNARTGRGDPRHGVSDHGGGLSAAAGNRLAGLQVRHLCRDHLTLQEAVRAHLTTLLLRAAKWCGRLIPESARRRTAA